MDPHVFVVVTLVAVLTAATVVVTVYARTLVRELYSTPEVPDPGPFAQDRSVVLPPPTTFEDRLHLPDGAQLEYDTRPVQLWPEPDAAGITGCWGSVWTEARSRAGRRVHGSWVDCGAPATTVEGLCDRHAQLLTTGEPA